MSRYVFLVVLSLTTCAVSAQISDRARDAIITILLSNAVERCVFFDYPPGTWNGAHQLTGGRYAFIPPDTTFLKIYPNIREELPYTVRTDSLVYVKKIYSDTLRGIYVQGILAAGYLFTVFTKLEVNSSRAEIDFFTTSLFDRASFKENYVQVQSTLVRRGNKWVIETCHLEKINWRKMFEPTYFKPKG